MGQMRRDLILMLISLFQANSLMDININSRDMGIITPMPSRAIIVSNNTVNNIIHTSNRGTKIIISLNKQSHINHHHIKTPLRQNKNHSTMVKIGMTNPPLRPNQKKLNKKPNPKLPSRKKRPQKKKFQKKKKKKKKK